MRRVAEAQSVGETLRLSLSCIHLEARLDDENQCILVLVGATLKVARNGSASQTVPASTTAQSAALSDAGGLNVPPQLDSALAVWKAAAEVWSKTREHPTGSKSSPADRPSA
jgi:hypothetical protein